MSQYIVKVKDYEGEGARFQINNLRQRTIDAAADEQVVFDQSDASNAGHPLRIALYQDGKHLTNGSEYTEGVTTEGTPGEAGAKTTFTVSNTDLHGTYFYYCENHRYMGGMIHYGSDSIPSGQTVPAKYRIIDEGATAYDDQDGDITSSIETTAELYDPSLDPPWGVLYDSSLYQVSHTNPWAVINTDTRNTAKYRIIYDVTDSAGVAAWNGIRSIDIRASYIFTSTIADRLNDIPDGTVATGEVVMVGPWAAVNETTYTKSGNGWDVVGFNTGVDRVEFIDNNGTTQVRYIGPNLGDYGGDWYDVSFQQRPGFGQNSGYTVVMESLYMPDHHAAWYSSTAIDNAISG